MKPAATFGSGILVLLGLLALGTLGTIGMIAAGVLAVGFTMLVVLGTDRLGTLALLFAMLFAPLNDVRPADAVKFVTFSDLFFLVGFALLVPTMLMRKSRVPIGFAVAGGLVLVTTVIASLLNAEPLMSLNYGFRLVSAVVVLPLLFLWWRPSLKLIDGLAWAFVAGQVISLAGGFVVGANPNGRYMGLTTHTNFFALGALMSFGMLIHLYSRYQTTGMRLLVWAAGVAVITSAVLSGSRASLLGMVMLAVLYPLVERSALSAYLVVSAAIVGLASLNWLISIAGESSALARLKGDSTASYSDLAREQAFATGLEEFLAKPLQGNGFDITALDAHNVYLQVAVGIGIFGALAFVMVLWNLIVPLFRPGPMRRLGYVPLSYAAVAVITNSLWDRFVWAGLALAALAAVYSDSEDPSASDDASTDHVDPSPVRRTETTLTAWEQSFTAGKHRAPTHTPEIM
ncbi:O-antigen ligase family protein [Nocardioides jensenii]|uniref:O-antigen ligase family protein n=1 Tax=Nocardioides jensenii TaxID=1843 RepID=UPI00082C0823|nr:O-antigen ligase family protein [Nocardioides jensenii]